MSFDNTKFWPLAWRKEDPQRADDREALAARRFPEGQAAGCIVGTGVEGYPKRGNVLRPGTKEGDPKVHWYTGTLVVGIATMHKSNAVPVISQEQATDISRMK